MKRMVAFVLFLALAGACGSDDEPRGAATHEPGSTNEATSAATTTTAVLPREWTECRNGAEGYSIAYPRGWHTAALTPEHECAFFDPERFEIVEGSEFPSTALEAHWLDAGGRPVAKIAKELTDPMFERTIALDPYAEGKLSGLLLETESTGEGLLSGGTRTYAYLLDVGGRPFIVKTTESPTIEYGAAKAVVDEAVGTLRFFASAGGRATEQNLPGPVADTRRSILEAAQAGDYEALATLIPKSGFTYTYGAPVQGGATAYWRQLENVEDPSPLATLVAILEMPYTKVGQDYVWPFAYDRDPTTLTAREREMLRQIASEQAIDQWAEFGHYLGWRTGIRSDGTWVFFVAGD